jgi:RNase H-fold protein (predicted Holliday junction resolvase)
MGSDQGNTAWEQIAAIREEFERDQVVVPIRRNVDGRPRELSPKAREFAEALAFSDSWSRIPSRRRRMAA